MKCNIDSRRKRARFSTVAVDDESAVMIERVTDDPYGVAKHHRAADIDGDGATSFSVEYNSYLSPDWSQTGPGRSDLNRDGVVNTNDLLFLLGDIGAAAPSGVITRTGEDNIVGYDGYLFNAETRHYHVRFRVFSPDLGRWIQRDPAGYITLLNLYDYVLSQPVRLVDPFGEDVEFLEDGWIKRTWTGPRGQPYWLKYRHVYDNDGGWMGVEVETDTSGYWARENWGNNILNNFDADYDHACRQECERKQEILITLGDAARCVGKATEVTVEIGGQVVTLLIPGPFDEAAIAGLTIAWKIKRVRRLEKICEDHLKLDDIKGARRERRGEVVKLKESGVPWDHIHEVEDARNGLRKMIDILNKELSNPNLCEADRKFVEQLLARVNNTMTRYRKSLVD